MTSSDDGPKTHRESRFANGSAVCGAGSHTEIITLDQDASLVTCKACLCIMREVDKTTRRVLDHGYTKLVGHMGNDNTALEDARMSTDNPTGVNETADNKLRDLLLYKNHTGPWEGMVAKFELQLPIFCLRQIDRHRTLDDVGVVMESSDEVPRQFMSRNEFSGRYSAMPDLFYVPLPELVRTQSKTNKQSSDFIDNEGRQQRAVGIIETSNFHARQLYKEEIDEGVAREQARMILPLNQYTKVRFTGSALSWMKFLKLRLQPDVQWETRMFCKAIGRMLRELWPKTWAAYEEQMLYTVTLRRSDLAPAILDKCCASEDILGTREWNKRRASEALRCFEQWSASLSVDLLAEEPNETWEIK